MNIKKMVDKSVVRFCSMIMLAYISIMVLPLVFLPLAILLSFILPIGIGFITITESLMALTIVGLLIDKIATMSGGYKIFVGDIIKTYGIYLLWLITGIDRIPKYLKLTNPRKY